MMMLDLFSVGLRFVLYPDSGLDKGALMNVLFENVPASLAGGVKLYCCNPPQGEQDMERVFIAVLSNLPLKRAKLMYQTILRNQYLCSHLTQYRPFVQNNHLERCSEYEYLGMAAPSGELAGGNVAYGCMRFCGAEHKEVLQIAPVRILSAAGPLCAASSMDVNRLLMRAASAAQPLASVVTQNISCGGKGTTDAYVISCGGKYVSCQAELPDGTPYACYYGLLPDDTAVIDTSYLKDESSYTLGVMAVHAVRAGCRRLVVASGDRAFRDRGEGCKRALMEAPEQVKQRYMHVQATVLYDEPDDLPTTVRIFTDFESIQAVFGLDAILEACHFEPRMKESTHILLVPGKESERVKRTVEYWSEQCRRHLKKFASPSLTPAEDLTSGLARIHSELTQQVEWLRLPGRE